MRVASSRRSATSRTTRGRKQRWRSSMTCTGTAGMLHATGSHMRSGRRPCPVRGSVGRTFAQGSSICGSGYYHGVLERSLVNVRSRTPEALGAAARTLCKATRARVVPWVAYQCFHGLGHGLMIATGLSLPVSLEVCKRLSTRWDRDVCKGGVFMENLSSSYGFRSRWLRDKDPVYPCNWVAREDKFRCYQMVTSRILPAVGDDWDRAAEKCSQVEKDFVHVCFQSLGRDASSRSNRDPRISSSLVRSRSHTVARATASQAPQARWRSTTRAALGPRRCARRCPQACETIATSESAR